MLFLLLFLVFVLAIPSVIIYTAVKMPDSLGPWSVDFTQKYEKQQKELRDAGWGARICNKLYDLVLAVSAVAIFYGVAKPEAADKTSGLVILCLLVNIILKLVVWVLVKVSQRRLRANIS